MEIWRSSQLLVNRTIVHEVHTERGKLYEVKDDAKGPHYLLRVYDASSQLSEWGIAPGVLKSLSSFCWSHPHLLRVIDVDLVFTCTTMDNPNCREAFVLLLFELASGNLEHWLTVKHATSHPDMILQLANDILQGLTFLHKNHFVHRRLTTPNILLVEHSDGFRAKLGDFYDLSVYYPGSSSSPIPLSDRDCLYAAPEILAGFPNYTPASDMWSFGILLHEMIFGLEQHPFYQSSKDNRWFKRNQKDYVLNAIFSVMGTPPVAWRETFLHSRDIASQVYPAHELLSLLKGKDSQKTKEFEVILTLIEKCLRLHPGERIKATEALQYFHDKRPVRGSICAPPKCHRVYHLAIRKPIIERIERDVSEGLISFQSALMAIWLFDVNRQLAPITEWEDLFQACCLVSLKMLNNVDDVSPLVKGLIASQYRLKVIEYERQLVSAMKRGGFFVDHFVNRPKTMSIFQKLYRETLKL